MARISHLAVVIAFDNPRPTLASPLKERSSSPDAHRHAKWVLVGWCDECSDGIWRHPRAGLNIKSLFVHGDTDHSVAAARAGEDRGQPWIRGILNPCRIAEADEDL